MLLKTSRVLRVVLLHASFLLLMHVAASPVHAEVVRTGYSPLVASFSGKCLDVAGGGANPQTQVVQYDCNASDAQQWNLQPFNGAFRVIVKQTGKCLNIAGGVSTPAASIIEWPCVGADNELWYINPVGHNLEFASKLTGQCLNIYGGSVADGANLIQWPCDVNAPNELFSFSSGLITPSVPADLLARHSGQCMNVAGGGSTQDTPVIQSPCQGADNEQWFIRPYGNYFQIVAKQSNQCLNVEGGGGNPGSRLIQWPCVGGDNELWTLNPYSGSYQLIGKQSGLCANVAGASQSAVAQVIQSPCQGASNELWSLSTSSLPVSWTAVIHLPLVPAAAANLPNGDILTWSSNSEFSFEGDVGSNPTQTYTAIFDPSTNITNESLVTSPPHDLFCPGTAVLSDGRVLVNGGSSSPATSLFNPATNTWAGDANMNIPRGYEADTFLTNGSVLTLGGSWSGGQGGKTGELWSPGSGWRVLTGVPEDPIVGPDPGQIYRGDNHAWFFAVSNGRVFHAGPSSAMHWIDTSGVGSITSAGARGSDPYSINGKAVLYDVGQIMKTGGAPAYQNTNATNAALLININNGVTVNSIAPMAYPRAFANGVVLPNGQVVIVGGQTYPVPFSDDTAVLVPEIWDPITQVFRQMAPMQTPRNYHSVALLLNDGRVFVAGGGLCGGCSTNHPDSEILSPPYLFNADGSRAQQATFTSAPAAASLGSAITVATSLPVMSFALNRLSATTHTVNNDERRIPLSIASSPAGNTYVLTIPADPGVVLPGNYMLFAMDSHGVPSIAATVRIN